jgi:predicted RNase H-like nuclease (RuvC/YqgF family)
MIAYSVDRHSLKMATVPGSLPPAASEAMPPSPDTSAVALLKARITELEEQLDSKDISCDLLEQRIRKYVNQLNAVEAERDTERDTTRAKHDSLQDKYDSLQNKHDSLKDELLESIEVKSKLKERDITITELLTELKGFGMELDKVKVYNRHDTATIKSLKLRLTESQSKALDVSSRKRYAVDD